jgi:hypothetical protein
MNYITNYSFIAIVAIWPILGALADSEYQRRGGMRPTPEHKRHLRVAIVACVVGSLILVASLVLGGLGAPEIVFVPVIFGILLFKFWEFARWRMRMLHPPPLPLGPMEARIRRAALVLAIAGAVVGGVLGYYAGAGKEMGGMMIPAGALNWFVVVWTAMAIVRWTAGWVIAERS